MNIGIMPIIDYSLFNLKKDNNYFGPMSTINDYFKLLNFGITFFFNPYNNDKNEKH